MDRLVVELTSLREIHDDSGHGITAAHQTRSRISKLQISSWPTESCDADVLSHPAGHYGYYACYGYDDCYRRYSTGSH